MRVLIVDDEEELLDIVEMLLEEQGLDVLIASHAEKALDLLRGGGGIDLLFTDITMPGMDGIALARAAREVLPEVKVLYTTGRGGTDVQREMFVEGAEFLAKPYRLEELIEAVTGILEI